METVLYRSYIRRVRGSIARGIAVHLISPRAALDLGATTASSSARLGVKAHPARESIAKLSTVPSAVGGVRSVNHHLERSRRCVGKATKVLKISSIGRPGGSSKRRILVDLAGN